MSPARAGLVVLVAATHLGAATLPCPAPTTREGGVAGATRGPGAHAVDDHAASHGAGAHAERGDARHPQPAGAEMAARCRCGCGSGASGNGVAGRLGPALLRAAPETAAPPCHRAAAPTDGRLPDGPPRDLDPVPI